MSNWEIQISKFVNRKHRVLVVEQFHGSTRREVQKLLLKGKVDVLLTSYQTMAVEYRKFVDKYGDPDHPTSPEPEIRKPKEGKIPFFMYKFHRVVLDEGESVAAIFRYAHACCVRT
jgi:SNF2-related domain